MKVSDTIAIARKIANAHARIARVVSRLRPVLQLTGTVVYPSWGNPVEIAFNCQTVEDAGKVAAQFPVKLELVYSGHSSMLTFEFEMSDVQWEFRVPTIRPVTIDQCNVVRKKRRNYGDWHEAFLFFNEYELCHISYRVADRIGPKAMKEKLWKAVIAQQKENHRLERFRFVL